MTIVSYFYVAPEYTPRAVMPFETSEAAVAAADTISGILSHPKHQHDMPSACVWLVPGSEC